jgi:polyisoprenoid-binding protein YceI
MKSRNLIFALILMLSGSYVFAQKMAVNTSSSTVEWLGKKIGGQHNGFIEVKNGYFNMEGDQIKGGEVVIDMNSITNVDLKDETYNQKLVGHLKSDDFFGVKSWPTATFTVKSASKFSNGISKVNGEITIKGKTEPISFDVIRSGNKYSTKLEIDRSKFDVRYGSNSFFDNLGDKAIDDIFTLDIKLVLS